MQENPFFKSYNYRDSATAFSEYKVGDYLPALHQALTLAKQRIAEIKGKTANFNNTILALETSSEELERISGVYFNLFSAEADDQHQALAAEISPLMAAFSSDILLDNELFKKVKEVFESSELGKLTTEQQKLVDKYYKDFSRNGALLAEKDKESLRAIDQELSALMPKFSENVLKATNAFELVVNNRKDLLGLPDGVVEAAAFLAQQKNLGDKAWVFNLQAPSFLPFMQYANNRELRKKMWMAFNSRCYNDAFDNVPLIKKIVGLRHQRAKLLGFNGHADFVLTERMAQNSKTVMDFLIKMINPARKAAERDMAELRSFKKNFDGSDELMPWDFAFYSEKLKEKKFSFSDEELRPYFKLENVIAGVFEHARRLYGLSFREIQDIPKYHPDVKTYEVRDESSQKYLGLFCADFFPRETKKDGAWMTTYREQGWGEGQVRRPHVSIVCNFTKPTPTKPSLLTYDEVTTLFHEFGHSLHSLLSNCTYRSIAGTNVYWDFVELPSQIMENWVKEKEGLDIFAHHYQTGEAIPAELIEKIKLANKFQAGYYCLRQISFGLLDMAWHDKLENVENLDIHAFETKAVGNTQILPDVKGISRSCSFSHIFPGGYSAGYYSYKWAEVLDADAFEYFKEKGIFNREIAKSFRENILARGGTEHPMELYKKFRGRTPDPDALLRRDGLLEVRR